MTSASRPLRRWWNARLQAGPRLVPATMAGVGGVAIVTVALAPLWNNLAPSALGLLLVLPVVVAAVLGGRWPGFLTAAAAGVGYAIGLRPFGSMRVELAQDLAALTVFFVVAIVISTLVSRRIEASTRLEQDRALLLRSVSHDLRTPLATIRGAATELLDDHDHTPAVQRRMLHLIDSEAQRLDRLVANLLSLSRIEANAMSTDRQPLDLGPLVERAAVRASRLRDQVEVVAQVDPGLPRLDADQIQLDQLLSNLLENAVRHSPLGSPVSVTVRRSAPPGDSVEITVTDRGPGVSPDEVDTVFQPFRSGHIAGSSGVGLAICRAVASAHGGTISVDDHDGDGARFVVQLPLH